MAREMVITKSLRQYIRKILKEGTDLTSTTVEIIYNQEKPKLQEYLLIVERFLNEMIYDHVNSGQHWTGNSYKEQLIWWSKNPDELLEKAINSGIEKHVKDIALKFLQKKYGQKTPRYKWPVSPHEPTNVAREIRDRFNNESIFNSLEQGAFNKLKFAVSLLDYHTPIIDGKGAQGLEELAFSNVEGFLQAYELWDIMRDES